MRSFIAIEVPEDIRERVATLNSEFRIPNSEFIKWVNKENLHLTLIFLGEVKEDFLEKVKVRLSEITSQKSPFYLSLKGLGAFPNIRNPRVIWIGVKKGDEEIEAIQGEIEKELTKIGYQPEPRKFHPHLTIGRVKSFGANKILSEFFEKDYQSRDFLVESVVLFKSTLTPQGPIYEKLQESLFKK